MFNYNTFHLKNRKIQNKVISEQNYTYQTLIKLISEFFSTKGNVLDMGCGVGTIDFYLGERGHSVVGVDISKRAINLAKLSKRSLNQSNVNFEYSSLETYRSSEIFDYVISSEVLEHVESPEEVIGKINKFLKKGGIAIISTPSLNAPLYRWGLLRGFDQQVGHLRRFDLPTLTRLMENSGFLVIKSIKTEGLLRNLFYTNRMFGSLLRLVRYPLTIVVNFIDEIFILFLGESNIYLVVKKE